jgi:hypothetical protein
MACYDYETFTVSRPDGTRETFTICTFVPDDDVEVEVIVSEEKEVTND